MSLPFDATLKELVRRYPLDWLAGLDAELPPADAKRLLMAAWVLTGMRVARSKLKLLQEALTMVDLRDSTTYQLIVEEGMAQGLRTMLIQIGARRLGPPPAAVQESLDAIDDVARLNRMGERVLDVANWRELLDAP
ncbi:MAG TPA: hypothetical protein VNH11_17140 [Pirellulales bacterium]|nr:hypothetical protein [Pirellulales bacterium]